MKRTLLALSAVALLGAGAVACDDNNDDTVMVTPQGIVFSDIDVDANGFVSSVEWANIDITWDTNGDGFISPSEFPLTNGFGALDVDADNLLSQAEVDAAITTWDVNGDGFLDATELDPFL